MQINVNYTFKNDDGKLTNGSHQVDYRLSDNIDRQLLDELIRYEIKEKTGRVIEEITHVLQTTDWTIRK